MSGDLKITHVGAILDRHNLPSTGHMAAVKVAAPSFGLTVTTIGIRDTVEVEKAVVNRAPSHGPCSSAPTRGHGVDIPVSSGATASAQHLFQGVLTAVPSSLYNRENGRQKYAGMNCYEDRDAHQTDE